MDMTKPMMTPVEKMLKLTKYSTSDFFNAIYFKRLVKNLKYLTSTRLDITHGVDLISRFMKSPHKFHLQVGKRF